MNPDDEKPQYPLPQKDGWYLWKTICRKTDFDDLIEGNDTVGTDDWRRLAAEIGLDPESSEAAANNVVEVGFAVFRDNGLVLTAYGISQYHNVIRLGGAR